MKQLQVLPEAANFILKNLFYQKKTDFEIHRKINLVVVFMVSVVSEGVYI